MRKRHNANQTKGLRYWNPAGNEYCTRIMSERKVHQKVPYMVRFAPVVTVEIWKINLFPLMHLQCKHGCCSGYTPSMYCIYCDHIDPEIPIISQEHIQIFVLFNVPSSRWTAGGVVLPRSLCTRPHFFDQRGTARVTGIIGGINYTVWFLLQLIFTVILAASMLTGMWALIILRGLSSKVLKHFNITAKFFCFQVSITCEV